MAVQQEKVAVGYLVDTGKKQDNRIKAIYLNPEQYARALGERNTVAAKARRFPDVLTARVMALYDKK